MKLSQFKFKLPEDLIAQTPLLHRDECKLMVVHRKTGEIEHREFKDVINYFDDGDVMVFNTSRCPPPVFTAIRKKPEPKSRCSSCGNLIPNTNYGTCL